jgi:hypothetical protein
VTMRMIVRRGAFGASCCGNAHAMVIKLDRLRPRPCTAGAAVALPLRRCNL